MKVAIDKVVTLENVVGLHKNPLNPSGYFKYCRLTNSKTLVRLFACYRRGGKKARYRAVSLGGTKASWGRVYLYYYRVRLCFYANDIYHIHRLGLVLLRPGPVGMDICSGPQEPEQLSISTGPGRRTTRPGSWI